MQQLFRSLALLFAGGLTSIGGFVAARFVPTIEAVSAQNLPATASFFDDSAPAQQPNPAASLDPTAADWFAADNTPATSTIGQANQSGVPRVDLGRAGSAPDILRTAEVTTTTLGQPSSNLFGSVDEPPRREPSAFARATPQTTTAFEDEVAQFDAMAPLNPPTSFGTEMVDRQRGPLLGTTPERPSPSREVAGPSASAGTWDAAIEQLSGLGATDYRLVPIENNRLRCDVWILDSKSGTPIRRQFSAEGDTPVEAASGVVDVLSRQAAKVPASPIGW